MNRVVVVVLRVCVKYHATRRRRMEFRLASCQSWSSRDSCRGPCRRRCVKCHATTTTTSAIPQQPQQATYQRERGVRERTCHSFLVPSVIGARLSPPKQGENIQNDDDDDDELDPDHTTYSLCYGNIRLGPDTACGCCGGGQEDVPPVWTGMWNSR